MPTKSPKLIILPSSPRNRRFLIAIFGFCLGSLGLLYGIFWEVIFNSLVEKALILRPNSKLFELWKAPPLKLTLDMYLYNWTNPEEFDNPLSKPILQELGPYRFTEIPTKVDIKWHPENASITYRKQNYYYFDAEGSNGSLSDEIVTINSLAVTAAEKTKRWSTMRRAFIEIALKIYHNNIAIKKTANELIFGGYDDVLLNVGNAIPSSITDIIVPFDKFGYCYSRNGSSSYAGVFNMHTGADDIRKLGQLHSWNNKEVSKAFHSSCAQIHGSPGEFQPPYLQKNGSIDLFLADFCRSVTMDYAGPMAVEGVTGFKYHGGLRSVDNGSLYPENACYCDGPCMPSGLMNISSCWYGAPLFVSYPHFYNADPYYAQQVVGMRPQKEKHELYLVIEPQTGLALDVMGRFQGNILVEPLPYLSMFRHVPRIFFPLFWIEERVRITPDLASHMKQMPIFILGGQILGGFCFAAGLIIFLWHSFALQLSRHFLQRLDIADLQKDHAHIKANDVATALEFSQLLERAERQIRVLPKSISGETETTVMATINTATCPSLSNSSYTSLHSG